MRFLDDIYGDFSFLPPRVRMYEARFLQSSGRGKIGSSFDALD